MGKKLINPLLEVINKKSMLINPYMIGNGIPRDGLIGEWLFSGNANDTSGAGNNGTVVGATLDTGRKGVANTCYKLDASGEAINFGDVLDMGLNSYTISVWVKRLGTVSAGSSIFGKRNARSVAGTWGIHYDVTANVRGYFNTGTNAAIVSDNPSGIDWVHYLLEFNRTRTEKLYVNNSLQLSTASISASSSFNMQCTDGLSVGSIGNINSLVQDVRLYDRILTSNEKLALYNE
jgi:hypothetical protein